MPYQKQYYQDNKEQFNKSRKKYRTKSLKQINIECQKEWYDLLKAFCDKNNMKVGFFVKKAICEYTNSLGDPTLKDWMENFENKKMKNKDIENE